MRETERERKRENPLEEIHTTTKRERIVGLGREKGRQSLDLGQNTQRGFMGFNGFLFFDSCGLWVCLLYCDLWVWLMWRGEALVELLPLFHFYSWECGREE